MLISRWPSRGLLYSNSPFLPAHPTITYRHHADWCHLDLQNVPTNNREATDDRRDRVSCTSSLLHRVRILVTRSGRPCPALS